MTFRPSDYVAASDTVTALRSDWCLYSICIAPETKPIYLGVCHFANILKFPDAAKNYMLQQRLKPDTHIIITLLGRSRVAQDCYKMLRKYRDEWKPEANMRGHVLSGQRIITCIEGALQGQQWRTAQAAAMDCNVAKGTMSNHLNGLRGYGRIKGMRFVRGVAP